MAGPIRVYVDHPRERARGADRRRDRPWTSLRTPDWTCIYATYREALLGLYMAFARLLAAEVIGGVALRFRRPRYLQKIPDTTDGSAC